MALLSLRVRSALAATAALAAALGLAGCENRFEYARYPKELLYPVRTDLIVVTPPDTTQFTQQGPGRLDENIERIPSLGGMPVAKITTRGRKSPTLEWTRTIRPLCVSTPETSTPVATSRRWTASRPKPWR